MEWVLVLAVAGLALQQAAAWDLGLWLTDQGRDGVWAEAIAEGRAMPSRGPAAAGKQIQGPAYYLWMGFLRWLGIPGWRTGLVLLLALGVAVALAGAAVKRFSGMLAALVACGLWLGHPGLTTLMLTPSNPSWLVLLGSVALAGVAALGASRSPGRAATWGVALGVVWMLALQLHITAVIWAPGMVLGMAMAPTWRQRRAALGGLAGGSVLALLLLSGGPSGVGELVSGLTAGAPTPSGALPARVLDWLWLPARLGRGWLDPPWGVAAMGAVAHWVAVLGGLGIAAVRLIRLRGPAAVWCAVLVVWGLAGLAMAAPLTSLSFYYLVAAVPALYLAAGTGLAQSRRLAGVAAAVLVACNLTVFEVNREAARSGGWTLPRGAFWWTSEPIRFPTVGGNLEALRVVRAAGFDYPCAVSNLHGETWMDVMLDGGYMASRLLPELPGGCTTHATLDRGGERDGLRVRPEVAASNLSFGPSPVEPREPAEVASPVLRPMLGELVLPASRGGWRLALRTAGAPPTLGCGAVWQALGLGRYRCFVPPEVSCRVVADGTPGWLDVASTDGSPKGMQQSGIEAPKSDHQAMGKDKVDDDAH